MNRAIGATKVGMDSKPEVRLRSSRPYSGGAHLPGHLEIPLALCVLRRCDRQSCEDTEPRESGRKPLAAALYRTLCHDVDEIGTVVG
jgi:hypothetical protein